MKKIKNEQTVCFEADTVVEGFYKACEHLSKHIHTVGESRTKFTTADMTAVKNAVKTENDEQESFLYQVKTATGFYQCRQNELWLMTAAMEKADGVGPQKRKAFDIKPEGGQDASVILRLSFDMDKEVQRIKDCLRTDDDVRQILCHPVIDTATGVMVGSDGKILVAHKLKGYEIDGQSGLPVKFKGMLTVPKEVCRMKGRVTVEVVEGKWEESVKTDDDHTELQEINGIIVTATDASGRQGAERICDSYPNWRSVFQKKIGPAISIDTKQLADGVKRIRPQLSASTDMMTVQAGAGDTNFRLTGEDIDFSISGCVTVALKDKMPCDMVVALKASDVLTVMNFGVKTMHYKGGGDTVIFHGDDTMAILSPMITDDYKSSPKPPAGRMESFDIDVWTDRHAAKSKKPVKTKKKAGNSKKRAETAASHKNAAASHKNAAASNEMPAASNEMSLAERLRAVLLEQMKQAA